MLNLAPEAIWFLSLLGFSIVSIDFVMKELHFVPFIEVNVVFKLHLQAEVMGSGIVPPLSESFPDRISVEDVVEISQG